MSLYQNTFGPPEEWRYERKDKFHIKEICSKCEGLGLIQFQNSDFGFDHGHSDWIECCECRGSGEIKPKS